MTAILRFLAERHLAVNLVSLFLVAIGTYAVFNINREAFPNVNLDRIQVDVAYPGATPEEIERLVITPVEQELKSLNGIDKMTSVAFPGSGRIALELDPYATNRDRIASDVQLAVERARLPTDLPDDPLVTEIDGTVFPVLQIAVAAPRTELELKRLGDKLEDELLQIDGVAKVVIQGERKAELRIVVDPQKMREQRISVGEVADLVRAWNVSTSGGDIDTPEGQRAVRVAGEFRTAEELAGLVLRANERGEGPRLSDIANVTETLEKAVVHHDVKGQPALAILVLKRTDADIIDLVDRINEYLEGVPARHGADITTNTFQDFSRFARLRLGVLTNNAMFGVALVFLTLIAFLRPSVALTTTWGLPIVFLSGIYLLHVSGITLNLISMFGFIMVLGMLVDDAIIIGENITYHMERGMDPVSAAVTGTRELIGPVTTTVSTTIAAFLPLMFMSGIIGKFIVAIPVVVVLLLALSWLESFLMLPGHVVFATNPRHHPAERRWLTWLENVYAAVLSFALRIRWLTFGASLLVLAGCLYLAVRHMPFQLFPAVGVDQFLIRVTAPAGTSLDSTREYLQQIDRNVRARIDAAVLETTLLQSGEIAIDEGDPLTQRGSRFGQIRVLFTPAVSRPDHDALDDMRRLAAELPALYPRLEIAFTEVRPGPPVGRPLEVEIFSIDARAREHAATQLVEWLGRQQGVTSVESSLTPGDPQIHVDLDGRLSAYAGVDLATAAQHIRAAAGGLRVATTRRAAEEIDITIRYPDYGTRQLEALQELLVPNQRGGLVPLANIARFNARPGYTTVRHRSGIRVINVVADLDQRVLTSKQINTQVAEREHDWGTTPYGRVNVRYGGEEEKNAESVRGLAFSFLFALGAIFFLLAIQFNNLGYAVVVMLAIPFGVIGIIIGFYAHDALWRPMPLSFFALMGMVALAGVVVNSALVLLVFVQRAVAAGMAQHEAIVLAGRRRLRAVLLTATTTVVGLLPTAYGWGGMDPFVAPMALALSWGLIFATAITLITIPATLEVARDVRNSLVWLAGKARRRPPP